MMTIRSQPILMALQAVLVLVTAHSLMATTDKVDTAAHPKIKVTRPRAMVIRLRVLLKGTHPKDKVTHLKAMGNNNHMVALLRP
jgi:hypothetical protein